LPLTVIPKKPSAGPRSWACDRSLIDQATADYVAERGAFTVPTMAILFGLLEEGESLGLPKASMEKLKRFGDSTLLTLEMMKRAGVRMGLGTDLLGSLHMRQSTEFTLRAKVLPAIDVLRSACAVNAEILRETGKLGCIREGATADILVVDGNPLEDISVLGSGGDRLSIIMREGRFHKRRI
jgi:imidazolonepropionase-like amidohydrolase